MNIIYFLIRLFNKFISYLFYREFQVIDLQNLPKEGPVLLFCNHQNCYVDGVALVNVLPRPVSLISSVVVYQSSSFLSYLLTLSGGIPLERPWDNAYHGNGRILIIKAGSVVGDQTTFSRCKVGDTIELSNGKEFRITQIEDDSHVQVKSQDYAFEGSDPYRIIPKLSHEETYKQVWKGLSDGRCVAVFPEGDTHDKLELLPLKIGICIDALGAMEKYGKPVTLVPCGFSFENAHVFRSKMTLEFGPSFEIPLSYVELYRTNKSEALTTLFEQVNRMLKDLTYDFRHYEQYDSLKTMLAIYEASTAKALQPKQRMSHLRQIASSYSQGLKNGDKSLSEKLKQAVDFAKTTSIELKWLDEDSKKNSYSQALFSILLLVVAAALMTPGFLMYAIALLFVLHLTEKSRQHSMNTNSKNRLYANDIVSSFVMLNVSRIFPLANVLNFTIIPIVLRIYTDLSFSQIFFICLVWLLFQPIHCLLLVKLWDLVAYSIRNLRMCVYFAFRKELMKEMIELRKEILYHISTKLLKPIWHSKKNEESALHLHKD